MLAALVLFGVTVGAVDLVGSGDCPAEADVAAQLGALLPGEAGAGGRARLVPDGRALRIELTDGSGAQVVRRVEGGSCPELAGAAAVVIAAWQADLREGAPLAVRLQPPRMRRSVGFELSAGFVASLAGSDFAPGAEVAAALGPRRSHFRGRVGAWATGLRTVALGPGRASYTRAGLALGPQFRFRPGRFRLDLHADAVCALLYVAGAGFSTTDNGYDVEPGLAAGARAAVRLGGGAFVYAGATVVGWLREQQVLVTGGQAAHSTLPRLEVLLTAGLAFGND